MKVVRLAASRSVPLPIAETIIAAGYWASLAPPVCEGLMTIAPRAASPANGIAMQAGGVSLRCRVTRVPWGRNADGLLLVFREGDGAMLVVAPVKDAAITHGHNMAGEPRDTLEWNNVVVPASHVVAITATAAEALFAQGALAKAEQLVGAMNKSLRLAIDYAGERRQFGQAIGRFQAIQHLLAESAGELAAATAAVDNATASWRFDENILPLAVAKARAGAAAGKVAAAAHQVLGAIGFTHEHELHYSTRRLWSWRDECGADAYWEAKIGKTVCAAGGDALWDTVVKSS
jgi:acyl-CoA dehydrogenase